jgi:type IV pilus assembly protein PilV
MMTVRQDRGFTLVEVLVSLLVLAVGLLGLAMLQAAGFRFTNQSYSRTQATFLAYDIFDKMRANVTGFTAGNYDLPDKAAADAAISAYSACKTGACNCDALACDAATLARFDVGQWYSQQDTLIPGAKDASELATGPMRATIARNGNTATITMTWMETDRAKTADANQMPVSQTWQVEIY